ncbi:MAG: end-binding protein Ku [Thermoanaerobaculia bacterium]|jgi:DNA end-binding protein Ku|nr:end-binding protein Ku [Thermoanaerobaculia bacterium]
MALRPLRNATISFGLVSIPVRFYTATKSEDVHFHLLHESCGSRVNRKWWCPHHEKIVDSDELIRGYEISKNKYVTFTDEEMDTLETDDNRALEITEFVDLHEIDPVFYEKAYFLGPSAGGGKTYRLLSQAMKKQDKVAVARWVSNGREHLVVLRPYEKGLILHTMYYADEVRDFDAIDIEESGSVREKEVALAEMLINELTEKKFDPLQFKDDYRRRLLERIKAKSKGKAIEPEEKEEEKGGEVIDIMEALRRSLDKGRAKPAKRASARRAPAKRRTTAKRKKAS